MKHHSVHVVVWINWTQNPTLASGSPYIPWLMPKRTILLVKLGIFCWEKSRQELPWNVGPTIDGKDPAPVDRWFIPVYFQGFICPRWCRMSSINSITGVLAGNFDTWHWLPGWRFDTLLKREYVDAALLGILCPWYLDDMQNFLFAWDDFGSLRWFWTIVDWTTPCFFFESRWSRLVQLKVVHALILGRCHFPRDCHRAKRGARMITLCADMLKALEDCRREVQMIHAWLFWF